MRPVRQKSSSLLAIQSLNLKIDRALAAVAAGRISSPSEARGELQRRRARRARQMRDERFEWDDRKAASNLRKHKISFEVAREAFDADRFVDSLDDDPEEERYLRISEVRGELIAVIYTE